jgi:hypothetical protein
MLEPANAVSAAIIVNTAASECAAKIHRTRPAYDQPPLHIKRDCCWFMGTSAGSATTSRPNTDARYFGTLPQFYLFLLSSTVDCQCGF